MVVEEKNPTLELMVRDVLYQSTLRPLVVGKQASDGTRLMPSHGLLDADAIAPALRSRLNDRLADRLAPPPPIERDLIPLTVNRAPFFCSGCPHNWGTKVPEGAVVGMGTGCHGMTLLMDEERVGESIGITAMGNEGAHWIGMAPFVETPHVFQNIGDGTYFHSAQLAVQAAIGAGANVTYKLLYNDTVAMTGGQETSFRVGVVDLARILLLQGVKEVVITADDVGRYRGRSLPDGVMVHDRSEIVAIQQRLAGVAGVTVLIHDQECAAELRRARSRGKAVKPTTRVVINHRICEGCGDCGDVSNCLSVQPVDTPLGRKTQIDQASCNIDLSCLGGDCPAFMTVEVDPAASAASPLPVRDDTLPRVAGPSGRFTGERRGATGRHRWDRRRHRRPGVGDGGDAGGVPRRRARPDRAVPEGGSGRQRPQPHRCRPAAPHQSGRARPGRPAAGVRPADRRLRPGGRRRHPPRHGVGRLVWRRRRSAARSATRRSKCPMPTN